LYKYLSGDRIDVLATRRIRHTQPGAFNDLFETKPLSSKIVDDDEARRKLDEIWPDTLRKAYAELPPEVKAVLPNDMAAAMAEPYMKSVRAQVPEVLATFTPMVRQSLAETFDKMLGIMSLTEKSDNLLMWSHYASAHEGYVIGFDSAHPYFDQRKSPEDEFRHLRKVEYRAARPTAPLATLDGVDIFLVKSVEWEYEQEWRIMRPLADAAETIPGVPLPICLFDYPAAAVLEVILGARMDATRAAAVVAALKQGGHFSHVEVFRATPDEAEGKIAFKRIGI
jgi:hypothetical protein